MPSNFPPTPEQAAAVQAFKTGNTVVITAGAGAGKTSTLQLIAEEAQQQGKRVLYIAYNKAISVDAKARFPRNTTCSTAHALAFAAGGKFWAHRLKYPRQTAKATAQALGITSPLMLGSDTAPLSPQQTARLAMNTVKAFCGTADAAIGTQHVPQQIGYDTDAQHAALAKVIVPLAEQAWADLALRDGKIKYAHDFYFKRWQLSAPTLDYDVILLDEAQDADPVLADVVKRQASHAQLVIVGDQNQAIYAWRGCVSIMGDFPGSVAAQLSKSFRFGPAIADEANRWLELLDADLRMTGHDPVPSVMGPVADPDVIICRTNAGAVTELLHAHEDGKRVAMVGGGQDIKQLAEASLELQQRGNTGHPELSMFVSWQQVVDYVEQGDLGSEDLKVAVALIQEHGAAVVIDAIEKLVQERDADLTITTAHRSKGREWDRVRVAEDFRAPQGENGPSEGEMMLAYVTVTRAKVALDRGGLRWIDKFVQAAVGAVAADVVVPAQVALEAPAVPVAGSVEGGEVEDAQTRLDAARDPLARAVARLALIEAQAREGVRDDAARAADVRAIVEDYLGRGTQDVLAEAS